MRSRDAFDRWAEEFWEPIPERDHFPRDIEAVLPLHYEVKVVPLAQLSAGRVNHYLASRRVDLPPAQHDHPLDGCVVARSGFAWIFVEALLEKDERRMIVAHEAAHYWADYVVPRRRLLRRFGHRFMEPLDGQRSPSQVEILLASGTGIPLEAHYCYLTKVDASPCDGIERQANTLGCELIAPRSLLTARAAVLELLITDEERWLKLLSEEFGIPERWARAYLPRVYECGERPTRWARAFFPTSGPDGAAHA